MPTPEQQDVLDALAVAAVDVQVLLPDTATLVRPTRAADGYGGHTSTDQVVGTLPCRRKLLTGSAARSAQLLAPAATYTLTVPAGADVRRSDALLVAGQRFEVLVVPDNTFRVSLALLCAQVSS